MTLDNIKRFAVLASRNWYSLIAQYYINNPNDWGERWAEMLIERLIYNSNVFVRIWKRKKLGEFRIKTKTNERVGLSCREKLFFKIFKRKMVGNGEEFDFYFEKTLHTGVFTLQVLLDDYFKISSLKYFSLKYPLSTQFLTDVYIITCFFFL